MLLHRSILTRSFCAVCISALDLFHSVLFVSVFHHTHTQRHIHTHRDTHTHRCVSYLAAVCILLTFVLLAVFWSWRSIFPWSTMMNVCVCVCVCNMRIFQQAVCVCVWWIARLCSSDGLLGFVVIIWLLDISYSWRSAWQQPREKICFCTQTGEKHCCCFMIYLRVSALRIIVRFMWALLHAFVLNSSGLSCFKNAVEHRQPLLLHFYRLCVSVSVRLQTTCVIAETVQNKSH